jgi:homoaconitase/3-isopropylmalate dehydratase large subunit
VFDQEITFQAEAIEPMVTYWYQSGMGIGVTGPYPHHDEVDEAVVSPLRSP